MKRILIINVNWIGDVLFSTPFIKAVREANPDSYIACLLHPRCREMLELNPRLDEIIIYDEEGVHSGPLGKLRLIMELRRRRFDTAFILHRSFTKALIAFLAGAGERVGYPTKRRSFLLTKIVESPDPEAHKVEYFLNIARSCGIEPTGKSYEFFIQDSDREYIKKQLSDNGVTDSSPLIVICPGGNWDPKRWPKENFAKTADEMILKFGAKVAIAGAQKDIKLAVDIRSMMKSEPVILCGKTTLRQLGALFERAALVIANDTGPMHLAISMKARTIALFGPTSPKITGPYGKGDYKVISKNEDCDIPCYDVTCNENKCMSLITVSDVISEVSGMMDKGSGARAHNL